MVRGSAVSSPIGVWGSFATFTMLKSRVGLDTCANSISPRLTVSTTTTGTSASIGSEFNRASVSCVAHSPAR